MNEKCLISLWVDLWPHVFLSQPNLDFNAQFCLDRTGDSHNWACFCCWSTPCGDLGRIIILIIFDLHIEQTLPIGRYICIITRYTQNPKQKAIFATMDIPSFKNGPTSSSEHLATCGAAFGRCMWRDFRLWKKSPLNSLQTWKWIIHGTLRATSQCQRPPKKNSRQ